ncbi:MAG: ATP-binding protein [Butyricimonas virosa]|uniref:sensor histidine kinase n=1 Tax=Butyricimonas virosa TaxID=544645 RepID=UPI0024300849|nr:ATP-binding protein [Butyricimonas virosa]MBS5625009.1 PAS domain-containing protein [Porphyromonadaceae bacterium]MCI7388515.1 ATP-binding protein [Butyricimonas virosa]MDY4904792.1 ATP-binding protein [Butyricimonas virosa]
MKIKTKLTSGIGLLFMIIVLLGVLAISYIDKLADDTKNILSDNYNSLDYAKGMLYALDNLETDREALNIFMENLEKQRMNITEINESEATDRLARHFKLLDENPSEQNIRQLRLDLNQIMSLNMASIQRNSVIAEDTARQATLWISIIGICSVGIALALLLLFPSQITRPISELTRGIVEIAHRNYSKRLHFDSTREFNEVATSFNDMAERLEEYQQSSLASLLSSKKYLEAIVNSIHEPIIGLDHDRQILFVNNEALTVLNLKREQMIHQSADELSLKNDLLRRLIRELVHPNEKHEPLKIYADDKESFFQAVYVPIKLTETETEGEKQVGNVILLKNITEFKELDSAKTTFISTISHELKTPISAIMMSLKLLEDQRIGSLNDEQQSLASSIKENSDRLLNITGELLKLTQVETGKLILSPKITKPIELINYAVSATRVLAERFGCNIEVEYPEKIHKLFVDSEKIAWVITNLLSNAIHYSKENSRIIVGAKEVDQTIQIFVQDFGKGIDPRYHQSIFDRYFRVPGTKVQGSGLGLAISKDFVEAHDGKIWVESEIGKGSKFTIAFPVR